MNKVQNHKKISIRKDKIVIFIAIFLIGIALGSLVFAGPPGVACKDGIDNDGDGLIDYPNDPGCSSKTDKSEKGTIACDDGIDNNANGFIDYPADSGCTGPSDNTEYIGNSCADSDGGLMTGVQGTVTGYFNQQPYSNSDYCQDSATLVEYYCYSSLKRSFNQNCNINLTNGTTMCLNGACV